MIITVCGSMRFAEKFELLSLELEKLGHKVYFPQSWNNYYNWDKWITDTLLNDWISEPELETIINEKKEIFDVHLKYIEKSDAILIANYDKHGVEWYIWVSTLIEASLAHYLNKKIFILNSIPRIEYQDEIYRLNPIILNNNLQKIVL